VLYSLIADDLASMADTEAIRKRLDEVLLRPFDAEEAEEFDRDRQLAVLMEQAAEAEAQMAGYIPSLGEQP
jgi:hypothetical protein